jgi:hypothetical protein
MQKIKLNSFKNYCFIIIFISIKRRNGHYVIFVPFYIDSSEASGMGQGMIFEPDPATDP